MIAKTLYFGSPARLSLRLDQLLIERVETAGKVNHYDPSPPSTRTIPIEDIALIVLDNQQITLTKPLLSALLENAVALVTCDKRSMPIGMMFPFQANNTHSERFQQQLEASLPLNKRLWQQTIQAKIANQGALLREVSGQPMPNFARMEKAVTSGDTTNVEGKAAAFYWKNIFPQLPGFLRQRDGLPPNNLLNYGYAILRAATARAIVMAGLLPVCGIHHHNKYNPYCLADDLMEPYRPYVDRLVIEIMNDGLPVAELAKETKTRLLQVPVIDVKLAGKKSPLMVALSRTAASLAKCYAGETRKLLYPEMCP